MPAGEVAALCQRLAVVVNADWWPLGALWWEYQAGKDHGRAERGIGATVYITQLKVSNIRGFHGSREVDLQWDDANGAPPRWCVLAGRNGSGKTTLLQSLAVTLSDPRVSMIYTVGQKSWVSTENDSGFTKVLTKQSPYDENSEITPREPIPFRINFDSNGATSSRFPGFREFYPSRAPKKSEQTNKPRTWLVAGYGPFRRLGSESRHAHPQGPAARIASLFDEDVTLTEGVRWLIDLHLRRLEHREGAAELLDFALRLVNDGLLPDGFRVQEVNSDGLWVTRGSESIALPQMSDGYRTVTALVMDLLRHSFDISGTEFIDTDGDTPTVTIPGIVLIDEIDAHLHVSWQKTIGDWLKRHFPNIQFIVTSHSPYICQSADPQGLVRLPGVNEDEPPRIVSDELYQRVVYGSGDDALLTELFGVDSPYSQRAEEKRRRLVHLERKVLDGSASQEEIDEFGQLQATLTSSLTTRVQEISARIGEER